MTFPLDNRKKEQAHLPILFRRFIFALVCIGYCLTAKATMEGIPKRPNPPIMVNNFSRSELLNTTQQQALEDKLEAFARNTSNQIVIVIIDSLYGYDASEFAAEIGQQWQVGQKKFDNGIVILVKPTKERKVFIATGYGLEGAIPDITSKEIVEREIIPSFKEGNYYEGLDNATSVLMSLAKGEYDSQKYSGERQGSKAIGLLLALIIILIAFLFSKRGGGRKGFTLGNSGLFFWGGGFGGSGGFGGGGGGFGGGGFGGFGGGGFGGGGAGGSW